MVYSVALFISLCQSHRVELLALGSIFSRLGKVLLFLPHLIVDQEILFSMVRKISIEWRLQVDPSTVCDLLSVKICNDYPCYDNKSFMADTCTIVWPFYPLASTPSLRGHSIAHLNLTFLMCMCVYAKYYSTLYN